MKSVSEALLYGIADLGYLSPEDLEYVVEKMIEGGIDVLQLRAKGVSEEQIESHARRLVVITEQAGVPFIINDHPELVPSVGAQGAHVGQEDFDVSDARWRAGRALASEVALPVIGKSTHTVDQAHAAVSQGADYIGFGPLFATPTKPGRLAVGLANIREIQESVSLPVFCIGGIKMENLESVLDAGARRVVIVSGILQASDPAGYCAQVKKTLLERHKQG
jgi:thiamine-phosphate pyrophosphorylase